MVVFYVAIVLLLIGTNLRASRATATGGAERRGGRYRKHVVDYREGDIGHLTELGESNSVHLSANVFEIEKEPLQSC